MVEVKSVDKRLESSLTDFTDRFCFPFKWIEKMKSYSLRDFNKSFLIPRPLMDYPTNRIGFFYAFVMVLSSRKLRKYKKRLIYGKNKKEFLYELLFLYRQMFGFLEQKTEIFESLKEKGVVSSYNEFSFVVFTALVNLYHDLKHKDSETMREFEGFKRNLKVFLDIWRLELIESEDENVFEVEILKEGDRSA